MKADAGFGSVAETGAGAGDMVRCVASSDPRFAVGAVFPVVMQFGRAHVHSGYTQLTEGVGRKAAEKWYQIPVRGYGARWVKV